MKTLFMFASLLMITTSTFAAERMGSCELPHERLKSECNGEKITEIKKVSAIKKAQSELKQIVKDYNDRSQTATEIVQTEEANFSEFKNKKTN